ncbi:efflux RND transporter periplasmic adaptor subunit [Aliiglaciecola lipolytica]|uniref:HlyD family secretion protein n=1 Tax=Aliiglaciecola lipolytica E3 TaxID=1127673 RepID=K6XP45_9ALTE|nr:efflux RND transporter periplasmic adaptor subunit [Aliiglaciecola lipolytica]GAC13446.1 HlyD family secretion protein [Aliiglaciecola lipolytica E3]
MSDKSELLQSLKIDRVEESQPKGFTLWQVILLLIVVVIISVWATLEFAKGSSEQINPPSGSGQNSAIQTTKAPSQNKQAGDANLDKANPSSPATTENTAILNSSGYITARRMATVSAEIMGLITEVTIEEGTSVEEGQILARLDNTLAKTNYELAVAQLDVLKARINSIQANLNDAQDNHKRVMTNTFSSAAEKSRAQAQMHSLQANIESAKADLHVANIEVRRQQERLDDHIIRAPFSGVVTVKAAQPGEIVAPSSAGGGFTRTGICTIVDMESLEIEVDVNESFIGRVYPGQPVEAQLDAYPDWIIPASVIAIIPTADRAKATVQVRIKIEQADPKILPDMGVKVAFQK